MNKTLKNTLKYILFFAVGAFVFWWVYRDSDIEKIKASLRQADYTWLIVAAVLSLLSHISRALRWKILLSAMGHKVKTSNSFFSVMIMYLSNTALPRSGEFVRCAALSRYEKISFAGVFGTVVSERIIDFIMLFLFMLTVLFTQMHKVIELLDQNPQLRNNIDNLISSVPFIAASGLIFLLIIFLLYRYRHKLKHLKIYQKIAEILFKFKDGIISVLRMKKRGAFILHSVFIWVMYFLMIYFPFKSFEFTEHLGLLAGLTIFVMSGLGMVAPSPGGIGTWHFMVIASLWVYGITDASQAGAFAFAVHGIITLVNVLGGLISFILLPVVNKTNESMKDILSDKNNRTNSD